MRNFLRVFGNILRGSKSIFCARAPCWQNQPSRFPALNFLAGLRRGRGEQFSAQR